MELVTIQVLFDILDFGSGGVWGANIKSQISQLNSFSMDLKSGGTPTINYKVGLIMFDGKEVNDLTDS